MEEKNRQFVDNLEWERYLGLLNELLGRYHAKEEIANELSSKVTELNHKFSDVANKLEKIDKDVTKLTQVIFIEEEGKTPLLGRVQKLEGVVTNRAESCPFAYTIKELEKGDTERKTKDESKGKAIVALVTALIVAACTIFIPRILDWIHEVSK